MNVGLRALFAIALLVATFAASLVSAQPPGAGAATIQFRNETKMAVIVQGTSTMNGMLRRGQPMLLTPGKSASDFNVPAGYRVYSVYDANQPTHVLVRDKAVMVQPGRDASFIVTPVPGSSQQVAIVETK
ncbi:MAG: hypothetical protein K2X38_15660 [Gemmataceae bacterium]|nr:hypothetical protein [Gemmataceae bacterium]